MCINGISQVLIFWSPRIVLFHTFPLADSLIAARIIGDGTSISIVFATIIIFIKTGIAANEQKVHRFLVSFLLHCVFKWR